MAKGRHILRLPGSNKKYIISGECIIGRVSGDLVFPEDASMSREHARIIVSGNKLEIQDLNSANGTVIGSQPLAKGKLMTLEPGEVIYCGDTRFKYEFIKDYSKWFQERIYFKNFLKMIFINLLLWVIPFLFTGYGRQVYLNSLQAEILGFFTVSLVIIFIVSFLLSQMRLFYRSKMMMTSQLLFSIAIVYSLQISSLVYLGKMSDLKKTFIESGVDYYCNKKVNASACEYFRSYSNPRN